MPNFMMASKVRSKHTEKYRNFIFGNDRTELEKLLKIVEPFDLELVQKLDSNGRFLINGVNHAANRFEELLALTTEYKK